MYVYCPRRCCKLLQQAPLRREICHTDWRGSARSTCPQIPVYHEARSYSLRTHPGRWNTERRITPGATRCRRSADSARGCCRLTRTRRVKPESRRSRTTRRNSRSQGTWLDIYWHLSENNLFLIYSNAVILIAISNFTIYFASLMTP